MSPRRIVLGVVLGLYLLGLGVLVGVVVERMRFDQGRLARLAELDAATSRVRAHLMLLEKDANVTARRAAER